MIDLYTATPGGTRIGASNNFFINSIENTLDHDADLRPSLPCTASVLARWIDSRSARGLALSAARGGASTGARPTA
jgi:hypothetical protein